MCYKTNLHDIDLDGIRQRRCVVDSIEHLYRQPVTLLFGLHVWLESLVHQDVLTYRKTPTYFIQQQITRVMIVTSWMCKQLGCNGRKSNQSFCHSITIIPHNTTTPTPPQPSSSSNPQNWQQPKHHFCIQLHISLFQQGTTGILIKLVQPSVIRMSRPLFPDPAVRGAVIQRHLLDIKSLVNNSVNGDTLVRLDVNDLS